MSKQKVKDLRNLLLEADHAPDGFDPLEAEFVLCDSKGNRHDAVLSLYYGDGKVFIDIGSVGDD
jgi:hypothetical protein